MEKTTKKLKTERDTAVQECDKLKKKYDSISAELAVYKKKEDEKRYITRDKLKAENQRISREEQLSRSLQKALIVIDAHGLRDEYNHTKLNTAQRKNVLE